MSDPERRLDEAAARAARRAEAGRKNPEPSLGSRLGQIGALGWAIVMPVLFALVLGRWLDRALHSGVFFTAPAIMIGAAFGMWMAWKWMHRR
jgi:ATP synthase protein I